jgi:hypothetical protein
MSETRVCIKCETPTPIVLMPGDAEICPHCVADLDRRQEERIWKRKEQARAAADAEAADKIATARETARIAREAMGIETENLKTAEAQKLLAQRVLQRRRLLPFVEAS